MTVMQQGQGLEKAAAYIGRLEVPIPPTASASRKASKDHGHIRLSLFRHTKKSPHDAPSPAVLAIKVPKGWTLAKDYKAWAEKLLADFKKDKAAQTILLTKVREALVLAAVSPQGRADGKAIHTKTAGTIVRTATKPKKIGAIDGWEERWVVGGVFNVAAVLTVVDGILYVFKVHAIEPYFSEDAVDLLGDVVSRTRVMPNMLEEADKTALSGMAGDKWQVALREMLTA